MWRHRFALFVAVAAFLLVIAGSLVTTTGSALAVPDWPLAFGQVFPRMEGGVLFEHGHRMIAGVVVTLVVIQWIWTEREDPRKSVRWLSRAMVASIIVQALLGGATVLLRLPVAISSAHAGLAEILFAMTVVMAEQTANRESGIANRPIRDWRFAIPAVVIFAQIMIGAIVRHTGAGLAIMTFPLADGRLIPAFTTPQVAWHFAHRAGAVVVAIVATWTAITALRTGDSRLRRPSLLMLFLVLWQWVMGALTIFSFRGLYPTTAHVAGGALLFVTSVLLAVRSSAVRGAPSAVPVELAAA